MTKKQSREDRLIVEQPNDRLLAKHKLVLAIDDNVLRLVDSSTFTPVGAARISAYTTDSSIKPTVRERDLQEAFHAKKAAK
jgi:hypothetical protein